MRMLRVVIPSTVLVVAAISQPAAQTKAPTIPICAGMTLVTAANDASGDYESIKTIEGADAKEVRIKYSAQKLDLGDMFSDAKPTVRTYLSRRVVRREDMQTSRAYLQEFNPVIPEAVPGMTALGTSALVLQELKQKGKAEFGISHWVFVVPPGLNADDPQSIYRKQMKAVAAVEPPTPAVVTVLVNGVPTELPAIRVRGNFYSYISEFWFLDQADNPLTLKFRIGLDEIKPLDADGLAQCKTAKQHGMILPQCLRPSGGDLGTLDLVKIDYRCGAASPAPGTGGGAGAPAAAAAGAGAAGAAGVGQAGAIGELQIEQALQTDGRAEIPDIFFRSDSDEIREESDRRLTEIAGVLKKHPDWKLKVEGHTDSIAADDYNAKLSLRRAAAVKNTLVKKLGIDAARLTPEGFGETRPRAPNDTLYGRARNRRVELVRVP
jgi:outer membrane protein OmpA-like peptidoglycan-associated protein